MTKRILAMILALAMVLSLAPTVVLAEGAQEPTQSPKAGTHTDGGHSTECTAHCGGSQTWTAWDGDPAKLEAGGHYYLTANTKLTGEVTVNADLHLCLNGYVLTAADGKRAMSTKADPAVTVTISDCTAYKENDQLVAGAITGGNSANEGGAILVQGGVLNLNNIRLVNNTSQKEGGAVQLVKNSGAKAVITGCAFAGNQAISDTTKKHGGAIGARDGTELKVKDCVFSGHVGANGGVILAASSAVTVEDSVFTDNSADKGGVFYTAGTATLEISGSTFTGNTATTAGAVMYMGNKNTTVKIHNTKITGNTCNKTSAGGAVYMGEKTCKLVLSGKVYIAENTVPGTEDLVLTYAENDTIYANGLTEDSYVEFSTPKTAAPSAGDLVVAEANQTSWNSGWLAWKNPEGNLQHIGKDENGYKFVDGHFHGNVEYTAWEETGKLPSSGTYYLKNGVSLTTADNRAFVQKGASLDLCMNGKTVTCNDDVKIMPFQVKDGSLYLHDCTTQYDANGYYVSGGQVINCERNGRGTAVYIYDAASVVRVEGIAFKGNHCTKTSAADGGTVHVSANTKPAVFTGCLFDSNTSAGGGVIVARASGKLTVEKSAFTNNQAKLGAVAYVNSSTLEMKDCSLTGNTGADNAISVTNKAAVTLRNTTITGNTCDSAVNIDGSESSLKLAGQTVITGNQKTAGQEKNLNVAANAAGRIDATGLTANSNIGVTLADTSAAFSTASASNNKTYFSSDNTEYVVDLNGDNQLYLKKEQSAPQPEAHTHCICGEENCTEHRQVTYKAWDGDVSKLAAGGKYYLTKDVQMSAEVTVAADLDLCLCGHTLTAASNSRHLNTADGSAVTITISDCDAKTEDGVYKAGKLTGGNITGNGGAICLNKSNKLYLYDGILSGNNASNAGGAIMVSGAAECYLYGGVIENNTAAGNGGAIMAAKNSALTLKDVTIQNNKVGASKNGGAVYVNSSVALTISGNTVVAGNKKGDTTSNNLHMSGSSLLTLKDVGDKANVGIYGVERPISNDTAVDVSARFFSDNSAVKVAYKDGKLQLVPAVEPEPEVVYEHCECGKADCTDTTHTKIPYKAWDGVSAMEAGGSYCLTEDLVLTSQAKIQKGTVNVCLHGHTITVGEQGGRVFYLTNDGVLNIYDCAGGGKMTGATKAAIMTDNKGTGMQINLYGGSIVGNRNETHGGAVVVQGESEFNMYGGSIAENVAEATLKLDSNGEPVLDKDGNQTCNDSNGGAVYVAGKAVFNMYGGEISGNSSASVDYIKADGSTAAKGGTGGAIHLVGTANLYGGVIENNTATGNGGAINAASNSVLTLSGVTIRNNTTKRYGGAAYVNATTKLTVSGDTVVTGNQRNSATNNLHLSGSSLMIVGNMGANANVGVTASARAISEKIASDVSAKFHSDDCEYKVAYKDGKLHLVLTVDHVHCQCGKTDCTNPDHEKVVYKEWNGDVSKLKAGQNYCLTKDVVVSKQAKIQKGTANVCLNGHTITVGEQGGRVFYLTNDGILNLSDCEGGGKLTGATKSAIMSDSKGTGMQINLYGGNITGNRNVTSGGAVVAQGECVFNMYGGMLTDNIVESTLTLDKNGKPVLAEDGDQAYVEANGGALYISATSVANMYGGEISGNTAKEVTYVKAGGSTSYDGGSGGAMYVRGIANLYGGKISGNTGKLGGGAVVNGAEAELNILGAEISRNKAASGGGVLSEAKSTITLSAGKISGNTATGTGGGVYVSTKTNFTMTGGSVDGNKADSEGGGICLLRSTAVFKGGSVSNNTAVNHGGVRVNGANVTIHNLSLTGNRATGKMGAEGKLTAGNGGGLFAGQQTYTEGGIQKIAVPKVTIYNIYVANNYANNAGGGMLIQSEGTQFTMYGGTYTNNTALGNGGALYLSTKTVSNIYGGSFYGNNAKASGAINFLRCQSSLSNVKIYDNTTKSSGGACSIIGEAVTVNMKNVEIYDNEATGVGGAMIIQSAGILHMEDSKAYNNESKSDGGAFYFSNPGYGTFKNVQITDNKSGRNGGGVFVRANAIVEMDNVTVSGNSAAGTYGGGIGVRARLVIKNSKVLNNVCPEGTGGGIGGFQVSSIDLGTTAGVFADNVIISGNEAGLQGGGVYSHRGCPSYLENCTITDNTSKGEGGGIYVDGRFGMTDSTVTGNTSGGQGHAVYIAAAQYDGHSYTTGHRKLAGDVIVRDNNGGDMYIDEGTAVAVVGEAIGEKAYLKITLHSGVLSEHLFGVYGYEGGNLEYTVTAGDRSITDPEEYQYYQEADDEAERGGNTAVWLYVGIGVIGLAAIAAGTVVVMKKKKAGKPAQEANKE